MIDNAVNGTTSMLKNDKGSPVFVGFALLGIAVVAREIVLMAKELAEYIQDRYMRAEDEWLYSILQFVLIVDALIVSVEIHVYLSTMKFYASDVLSVREELFVHFCVMIIMISAIFMITLGLGIYFFLGSVTLCRVIVRCALRILAALKYVVIRLSPKTSNQLTAVSGRCVVCFDTVSNVLMIPCNHLCVCSNCCSHLTTNQCPVCRQVFTHVARVFIC